jgi:Leucine-rich repeat (LRR) protein
MYVSGLEDVRFLSSFTQLEVLDIQATKVKSLSPLVNCISLKQIDLRGTGVSDLSPLTRCAGLVKIKFKKWPQQEEAEWQGRKMSGGQRLASLVRQQ